MSQAALSESFGPTIPMRPADPPSPPALESVSVAMLLKSPQTFPRLVAEDQVDWKAISMLLATAIGLFVAYGVTMGCFVGGNSLWQAALKTPMVLFGSIGLCSPMFSALLCRGGTTISVRQIAAILAAFACVTSLVMAGCAPVAWLFSVSTSSVPFLTAMHAVVWCVAIGCGLRLASISVPGGLRANKSLVAWAALFALVCCQMLTYVRPVLGVSPLGTFTESKKLFFYEHLYATITGHDPTIPPRSGSSGEPNSDQSPLRAAPLAPPSSPDLPPLLPPPPSGKPVSN